MELLKIENIRLIYQSEDSETAALENISFSVNEGEFIAIVGPSGCGKTTILSLIAGLIKPTGGKITIGGKEITRPHGEVGYMLQRDQLFEWRNISDNVNLGLEIQKKKNPETIAYAQSLLDKYGLKEFKKHFPSQLSGGMRQRVALIRTLAFRPKILLLDEPFSALDFQIIANEHKTVLLVTHDISEAIALSDRIIVLSPRPGKIKADIPVRLGTKKPREKRDSPLYPALFEKIWKEVSS